MPCSLKSGNWDLLVDINFWVKHIVIYLAFTHNNDHQDDYHLYHKLLLSQRHCVFYIRTFILNLFIGTKFITKQRNVQMTDSEIEN